MINKLKSKSELIPFFTTTLFENGVGVIIDESVNNDQYLAINIDDFYHHIGLAQIPEIADLLIIGKESTCDNYHIFIVEMKNINSSSGFNVHNIYGKFDTAINDFMKKKYSDPFLEDTYTISEFKLFFVHDAYHLMEKGLSDLEIKSFLSETKIGMLQSLPPFEFRGKYYIVDYKLPNPKIVW